jgi:hypothetical protein
LLTSTPPNGTFPTYQWQYSNDNNTFTDLVGGNNASFQPAILTNTTYYRQKQNSSGTCGGPLLTNTIIITVTSLPNPTITGPVSVCLESTGNTYTTQSGKTNYIWTITPDGSPTAGGTLSDNFITIIWSTAGTKHVKVNYTQNGCTAVLPADYSVTVNTVPIINGPSSTCINSQVTYTTQSGMAGYEWTIPTTGGTTFLGQGTSSVTVTWGATTADYSIFVKYTPILSNCTTTSSPFLVHVGYYMIPPIYGDPTACSGTQKVYSTVGGMDTYVWNVSPFGGTTFTGQGTNSITVNWGITAITSPISVNFVDPSGCSSPNPGTLTVTMYTSPSPFITPNNPNPICAGSSGAVYSTQTGMNNYIWTVPVTGGTNYSGQGTPTINVSWGTSTGGQQLSVTYSTPSPGNCAALLPGYYTQYINPLPTPTISGNPNPCAGTEEIYTTEGSPNNNWNWKYSIGAEYISGQGTNILHLKWHTTGSNDTVKVNYFNSSTCTAQNYTVKQIIVSSPVQASLGINSSSNPVCKNSPVTFTTSPVFGGSFPQYQWYKEINPIPGATSPTYTYIPNNGELIKCRLTSSLPCTSPVFSNSILIEVTDSILPKVDAINQFPYPSCMGDSVEFTALTYGGGNDPIFAWKKGAQPVGNNSNKLKILVNNGEMITCTMQSSLECKIQAVVSKSIIVDSVLNTITPSIIISRSDTNTICEYSKVTFKAIDVGGGANPIFQWRVDGKNVGLPTSSRTFDLYPTLTDDSVSCVFLAGLNCASPFPVTSNLIVIHPQQNKIISVSLSAIQNPSCQGKLVELQAIPMNGGSSPVYRWFRNDTVVPIATSSTYSYFAKNGDQIKCELHSSAICKSNDPATSVPLTIIVTNPITPAEIVAGGSEVCLGEMSDLSTPDLEINIAGWQKKYLSEFSWQTIPNSKGKKSIHDSAIVAGTLQYRTEIQTGGCDTVWPNPISITIIKSPEKQILTSKADQEHKQKGDLFLLCETCKNDTLNYSYLWTYHMKNGNSDTVKAFMDKYFCIFPVRDTSVIYAMESGYKGDNSCTTITFYDLKKSIVADPIKNTGSIFPVPNQGKFNLTLTGDYEGLVSLNIRDVLGRLIIKESLLKESDKLNVPYYLNLKVGFYLVEIYFGEEEKYVLRMIVN